MVRLVRLRLLTLAPAPVLFLFITYMRMKYKTTTKTKSFTFYNKLSFVLQYIIIRVRGSRLGFGSELSLRLGPNVRVRVREVRVRG
jgi:hypothetical protein